MQLNPMHLKVAGLLGGRLFRIPEYQRAYAWGTRQRTDLFNDIRDVKRSGREHFMATVVALSLGDKLIGADSFRTVEIVDGQQRITTIVILMKAIEKALDKDDQRQDRLKREIADLLIKDDDHSPILLQTNHDDGSVFTDYIREGNIADDRAKTSADLNVVDAARECEGFVSSWVSEGSLVDLVAVIRNQLSMIYHEISDEATVYRVFEVLNSRGLDVKWIDKLKSQLMALLYEHVEAGTRADAVREMQNAWSYIYRILGPRGNLGDEALRFAGTWSLLNQPNRIISQEDAAEVLTRAAGTQLKPIMAVGTLLKRVVEAVDTLDQDVRLRAVTKIAHARFLASSILLRKFEPATQQRLLRVWERVTFRIFGLGGADTRHKIGDYVRLGYKIASEELSAEEIESGLSGLGSDWKIAEILGKDAYWSNSYEGWTDELRHILFRYDEHLAQIAGHDLSANQWNKIWLDEPSRSIEHIAPQSSGVSYRHHLGNLTVLAPNMNSSLNAKPPVDKAGTYSTSGLLGTIQVGQTIAAKSDWGEADVLARADQIDAFVRGEWGE